MHWIGKAALGCAFLVSACDEPAPQPQPKPVPAPPPTPQPRPPEPPPPTARCEIILYVDSGFQGASQRFLGDVDQLTGPFHDGLSSMRVRHGTWRLFEDAGYGKPMGDFEPGDYASVTPNDRASSMRCTRPG